MGKKGAALLLVGLPGLAVTSPAGELSVLPPQEGCGDVLQQAGLVLPGLEFLVCRREGQPALEVATGYGVTGQLPWRHSCGKKPAWQRWSMCRACGHCLRAARVAFRPASVGRGGYSWARCP